MADEDKLREYLKRAVAEAKDARDRLREAEDRRHEPIAIVGMGCRYPGGVASPADLWRLVAGGVDAVGPFPSDRGWDVEGLYDPDPDRVGHSYTRSGGFLSDPAGFDAGLFGMSPREALATDPQQRLLLQTAWEALEHAGIRPDGLRDRRVGVYTGLMYSDYGSRPSPGEFEGYLYSGSAGSVAAGRLSYVFGLVGPSIAVDTACSSSLVALHLAMNALRRGECDLALAGGAAVMATPMPFLEFSRQRGLSPDGRCKAFGAGADGTGWAEGVGVLAVERLSDAVRSGHHVLAVLRGSAVNSDGASNGLTAPNGPSQERVILAALADSGLTPSDVDAVEGHGTGTALGDPIEANALLSTYGRDRDRPLWLGSLKSNIGHAQAAAGVGGIIKVVEALRHGVLPRTLHADDPSPRVDWDSGAVRLLTEQQPWPVGERPRRAGVSSFGFGGTNAHVIVEEYQPEPAAAPVVPPVLPWVLSAADPTAVRDQAVRLLDVVDVREPADVARTLATGRARLAASAVVTGRDRAELVAGLRAVAAGGPVVTRVPGRTGFLFPGQGAQRAGMGLALAEVFPAFGEKYSVLLERFPGLREAVASGVGLDGTGFAQPGLFALGVALAELVGSWGVRPDFVAGHSVGEMAAAHIAGVLSLDDAVTLVSARARLMAALPTGGAMVAVRASEQDVLPLLETGVEVAAVNGPRSVVLSGDEEAVSRVADRLAADGVKVTRLTVSHAFHSARMDPMLAEFRSVVARLDFRPPQIPAVSTVTGEVVSGDEFADPDYWVTQVRRTVRFGDAVRTAAANNVTRFLELGPATTLSALVETAELPGDVAAIPLLRAEHDEATTAVNAIATLGARGADVDWAAFFAGARTVPLPTYPFRTERYWIDPVRTAADAHDFGLTAIGHPVLGAVVHTVTGGVLLTGRLSLRTHPWLADHRVGADVVVPGAAVLDWVLRAGVEVAAPRVRDLALTAPLVVGPAGLDVQVEASADGVVAVHARADDGPWTTHATGTLAPAGRAAADALSVWPPAGDPVDVAEVYRVAAAAELEYGPAFRGLVAGWRSDVRHAEIALPAGPAGAVLDPALLDAALHVLIPDDPRPRVPFAWAGVEVLDPAATPARARLTPRPDGTVALLLADAGGRPVATVDALTLRPLTRPGPDGLHTVDWRPVPVPDRPAGAEVFTVPAGAGPTDRNPVHATLARLQRWLADDRPGPLVVHTRGAIAAGGPPIDPAQAPVWGLVRSAQAEHPDRFVLVDGDGDPRLAAGTGRPQVAIRAGALLVPRLTRAPGTPDTPPSWSAGTVLVTGATGALGAALVRHLVDGHGARDVVLLSRRGPDAPGAADLAGPGVRLLAVDVTDRDALARVVADLPDLRAVVHLAGVSDDRVLTDLTPEHLDTALGPKADAAWHLHDLTRDRDLTAFVLYSSLAGVLGTAGQANYAAANTALDALAAHRAAAGLPAVSIAWGLWEADSALSAGLGTADLARLERVGVRALSTSDGMALFDLAVAGTDPAPAAARLDLAAAGAPGPATPGVLRTAAAAPAPSNRLAGLGGEDRVRALRDLVRAEAAAVLGHADPAGIADRKPFRDQGFDSLTAVELRNRVAAATGVRLPATVVFDHPDLAAFVAHLDRELAGTGPAAPVVAVATTEPIAIVGMGCRYPGGVASPADLWRLVAAGTDAVGPFPSDRGWDVEGLYDPDPDRVGHSYTRSGGFLSDPAGFDAGLFGMSPREALATDPQQRLLLETTWEAFESAGIAPDSVRGSRTGVFTGVMYHDYGVGVDRLPDGIEGYLATGSAGSVASGRVAYTFGLTGPALTVDTACSSSLVALHLAANALRRGECDLAVAGGAAVMATPTAFVEFSRQRGLSPDGRCKAFGAGADGTGWAEGVGVLVVERLSDARRNGHRVLAVVRGTAVNSDGASNGLTAPNGPAQEAVILAALADAGLVPSDVDVVEAHGTGTALGDPIEANALLSTYGRDRDRPLWLGSLKSNIGHSQAAAGVGGIIKVVEALRHSVLPRTLHAEEPSPHVDWDSGAVRLLTEQQPWSRGGRPRRAGVSSFGISGTNAHVVIEEPEPAVAPDWAVPAVLPLVVRGATPQAVHEWAARLVAQVADPAVEPLDVAATLATGRAVLPHRAVVVGADRAALLDGLRELADGPVADPVTGDTGFLFPGQGAQRAGMGFELAQAFPAFAEPYFALLDRFPGLREAVESGDGLDGTGFAQPGLFALGVALAELVGSWGVRPDFVVGHSVGEVAAAHVAGVLSLDDAVALVSARARLMAALPTGGAMVAVRASEEDVLPLLEPEVEVAAVNGPRSVVLSGVEEAVSRVADRLAADGVKVTRLTVSHAFHSARMDPMLDGFRDVVARLEFRPPRIPMVSTLTGSAVPGDELADPDYWVTQVRRTVRFGDAVHTAVANGVGRFVELGPDAVLTPLVGLSADVPAVALLRRERSEPATLVSALGTAHAVGADVDWSAYFAGTGARTVSLPTYPFEHRSYWLTAGRGRDPQGAPVVLADGSALLTGELPADALPLRHTVHGVPVLSGAVVAALALRVGESVGTPTLSTMDLEGPVAVPTRGTVAYQIRVGSPDDSGDRPVTAHVRTRADGPWTAAASGVLTAASVPPAVAAAVPLPVEVPAELPETVVDAVLPRADDSQWRKHWRGVRRFPGGVPERAAVTGTSVALLDADGTVVFAVEEVTSVVVDRVAPDPGDALFAVRWVEIPSRPVAWDGADAVLLRPEPDELDRVLADRLAGPGGARLVVAAPPDAVREWQERHPGRITALRTDSTTPPPGLPDGDEPVVSWLAGVLTAPRLTPAGPAPAPALDGRIAVSGPDWLTRHLAERHGPTRLLDADPAALAGQDVAAVFLADATAERARELAEAAPGALLVLFTDVAAISPVPNAEAAALIAFAEDHRARVIAWGRPDDVVGPVDPATGALLVDAALGADETLLVAGPVRTDVVRDRGVPALFRDLVPPAAAPPPARLDLSELDDDARDRAVLDAIRTQAAAVLGHGDPAAVGRDRAFHDAGFDSMTAVELGKRLGAALGVALPATALFDHATPAALAKFVVERLDAASGPLAHLAGLESALAADPPGGPRAEAVARRLRDLLAVLEPDRAAVDEEISAASVTEIFDLIDSEFGSA
ncbi:type I polyketide synthase [Actinosynnema sp. NPDC047251]|uniref:type I polyketide synthase n=1 Tax=Saccharothrix espanaensis TaxID=103731 RepID=UPI0002D51489